MSTLLAADRRQGAFDVVATTGYDRDRPGAVARRVDARTVRRAEPGPCGPLVLEARMQCDAVCLEVWGPPSTPAATVESALAAAAAWAGCDDDPSPLADAVRDHPLLRRLHRRIGDVRLSRLPRVCEALGRAVLEQLVQSVEAHRSIAQVVAHCGDPAPSGLWCWPTPAQLGRTHAWDLRPCGVSLRGAQALHAAALCDRRLREAVGDWLLLDRRLRALPGIGAWTSAEVRLALGDPDAVSVGDHNLPTLVGNVLGSDPDREWDDAAMLELLAPFAGQRGRVIRLVGRALSSGLVRRPRRRAPRAAISRHRYW